jgi:DNA repair photolyase
MAFKWSLNPYMGCVHRCTFCYVRHFEHRADRPSDERYGSSIRVKTNIAEVLHRELSRLSWRRENVVIGAATDPYQPAEARFRLTRMCIVELTEAWTPLSIITRGPLALRDVDVLQDASERVDVNVTFSIPTLDEEVWRKTEPGTAPPRSRLDAVRRLSDAGIDVGVGMAPILPGISDSPDQLEAVVRAVREAGARGIWANLLFLRPGTREHFLEALARDWPEEVARYEELYADRAYLPAATAKPVKDRVRELAREVQLAPRARRRTPRLREHEQLSLV